MSLKAIDLQMSIPRAHDLGKIQEQLQQRPVNDQVQLSEDQRKEIAKQQQKTTEASKTDKEKIKDQSKNKNQQELAEQNSATKQKKMASKKNIHPYKGHTLDISL
ncbi:hypothetical protein BHU72_03430 [Desulfuribacillus stibiiarsenatis]|uniref:Uncharacterized protein n=1 Tax=Desulfuribacillus stibiiarsenatis TaxID=1390249 RepID=A0A1E5L798_9FIRM|nr:hypothetical protein [Desulfuribacillus stibiiarsenatis]OEH85843.1 hypothetical protein BHU72_03430 [Desulfuribacillus stibiiarsenatis]